MQKKATVGLLIFISILLFEVRINALEQEKEFVGRAEQIITNLERHIAVLSKDIGERNLILYQTLERAVNYIKDEFKDYGYQPEEHIYYLENKPFKNIIATKKGKNLSRKIIIVCAHYDSVIGSPGADDNASGVAGLLELSRILFKDNLDKTVKLIAFTNEEPPLYLSSSMGSFRYVREAKKRGEDIEGALCLESIGFYSDNNKSQNYPFGLSPFYPDKANFIAMVSNLASGGLLKRIIKEFKRVSAFPVEYLSAPEILAPAIGFSDNWSFWRFGYKAVMITDTAFYRNPYYHTSQDTLEKLNYKYMAEVITGLDRVLLNLGG